MTRILVIAWREFRTTVLRKAFLLAIVGIPLLIVAIGAIAALIMMQHEEPPLVGTVAVVSADGAVAEAARVEFEDAGRTPTPKEAAEASRRQMEQMIEDGAIPMSGPAMPFGRGEIAVAVEPVAPGADDDLRRRVHEGELLAAAFVDESLLAKPDPDAGARPTFDLVVADGIDADHIGIIERRIGQAVVRVRASRQNLDPDDTLALLRAPRSNTRRILTDGTEASDDADLRELRRLIPMAFMMLLWIGVFTAGQHLLTSTIEEKSNRVMEVLLSAVSPLQLMTGKILGQGSVGLIIVFIYGSLGVGTLVFFALVHLIELIDLLYLGVFFFMAYFMIASIMAAVGGAVSDIREANTLLTPVMFILMIPLMLWWPIIESPNGAVAVTFSFLPPAIPFAMILRLAADEAVPVWQIPATIAWGTACTFGMVWLAAKIFRVGVLMYGKPPSPWQLVKWVGYR